MSQRIHTLQTTSDLDFPIEEVFEFFSNATNLERITPPELSFRILTPVPIEMRDGARIDYELSLFHIPFRWETEITSWRPNERFVDEQLSGPFRLWHHTHEFRESTRGTRMMDTVNVRTTPTISISSLWSSTNSHTPSALPSCLVMRRISCRICSESE